MIRTLTLLALLLAACAAEPSPPVTLAPEVYRSAQRYVRQYLIQPGDQLEVTVRRAPELTRTVIVRPDGFISLPILRDVTAAGLSVPDLNAALEQAFAQRLNEPEVSVNVLNPRQASVFVLGDVPRPGPVPARDAPTLAIALAAVGGTLRTGSFDNIAIIRLEDDGTLTGTMVPRRNYGETSFYMAMAATPVRAGDLVIVPESGRSQFTRFIADFVNTPLSGVNQVLSPYFQFQTLRLVERLR